MPAVPSALGATADQGVTNSALVTQPYQETAGTEWPGPVGDSEHAPGGWTDHGTVDPDAPPYPSPGGTAPENSLAASAGVSGQSAGITPSDTAWLCHDVP